jgi:hypothetical protein
MRTDKKSIRTKKMGLNINRIAYGLLFCSFIFSLGLKSQSVSTRGEIYDYEIGDIFHLNYTGHIANWHDYAVTNIEIVDKFYSQDTILNYIRDIEIKRSDSDDPEWIFEVYLDTMRIISPNSLINGGLIDSTGVNLELYNGRLINYYYVGPPEIIEIKRFVVGCGKTYDNWHEWDGYSGQTTELVYYKKGNEEWGIPIPVSIENHQTNKYDLILYPNPAKSNVNILSTDFEETYYEIYDISGNVVIKTNKIDGTKTIDISDLKKGLYIVVIKVNQKIVYRKLIKE